MDDPHDGRRTNTHMKLTTGQLRRIIREEVESAVAEAPRGPGLDARINKRGGVKVNQTRPSHLAGMALRKREHGSISADIARIAGVGSPEDFHLVADKVIFFMTNQYAKGTDPVTELTVWVQDALDEMGEMDWDAEDIASQVVAKYGLTAR
jgi:hypothetical protein